MTGMFWECVSGMSSVSVFVMFIIGMFVKQMVCLVMIIVSRGCVRVVERVINTCV